MNENIASIFAAAKNMNHETAAKAATDRAYSLLLAATMLRATRSGK